MYPVLCFLALMSHLNSSQIMSSCFSQTIDSIEPCCSSHLITGRRAAHLMNSLFDLTMQMHFDVISSIDFKMLSPLV